METTHSGFAELLDKARHGSVEAMGKLWAICRLQLLATANEEISDDVRAKVGASDAVQETFLRAQAALERFSGNTPDELLAWLRTILRNHLSNIRRHFHTRKRQVGRELPLGITRAQDRLADHRPTPDSAYVENEQAQQIVVVLHRLSDDYRHVLKLRYWHQMSFPEIGRQMGRTDEAVRKLWARALVKLQQELDCDAS